MLQGKRCSCNDWSSGTRAGCLFSKGCHHLILAAVAAQGWLMAFCDLQVVHLLGLPLGKELLLAQGCSLVYLAVLTPLEFCD